MFDFTSSKLLILGLVALMVIGPKDLPALLRTVGKYMGMIKRHANDFRAQFEEAMRESELNEIKKQVETVSQQTEAQLRTAEAEIDKQLADAKAGTDPNALLGDPFAAPDAGAVTTTSTTVAATLPTTAAGGAVAVDTAQATPAAGERAPEKSGA